MKKGYQLRALLLYSNQSNGRDQDGAKGLDSGYEVDSAGPVDGLNEE